VESMIIAFSGNDGTGKTTIIKNIIPIFKELGFKVIYRHEYDYLILKYLFKIFGEKKVEKERKKMLIEQKKSITYYLWPLLVWFDLLVSYTYYKIFKKNKIVILDRYPYDHYLSFVKLGYITKLTEFLYKHFPKADVNILLWVEPEVAYERKKETHNYPLEFYEIQTKRYLNLVKELKIPTQNTNKPIKKTLEEIFDVLYDNEKFREKIIKKGMQNKTFFEVFNNYENTKFYKKFKSKFEERKEKYIKSVTLMRELFKEVGIKKYAVFKDYNGYKWIGNDVDVIISEEDFKILSMYLEKLNGKWKEFKIKYKLRKDHKKYSLELIFDNSIPLDIHTEIEWGGISLFDIGFLLGNVVEKENVLFTNKKLNAIIFSLATMIDKGFLTYLEYKIIKNNLELENINLEKFELKEIFEEYSLWINQINNENFLVFLPIFLRIYIIHELTKNKNLYERLRSMIKILGLQTFWQIRYKIKGNLPFEIEI